MNRSTKRLLLPASAAVAASVAMAVLAWSAKAHATPGCPENLCACLGAAAKYGVVSNKFDGGMGVLHERNDPRYPVPYGFNVDAAVCAHKARLKSRTYFSESITEDLVLLASKGIGGGFSARGDLSLISVGGDLVTAGGKLKGLASVHVKGVVDTTGANPKLPDCTQAWSDITAASIALRGLTATQTLPAIDVSGGTIVDINAGAGVNVIRVPSIRVRSSISHAEPNILYIHLDPATESVIINLDGSLDVGNYAYIYVEDNGGDAEVIINMSGAQGAKGSIGFESQVDPIILFPTGTIIGRADAYLSNVFAKRVVLRGANVTPYVCTSVPP